jgi:molybdate transport system ATP-binding protein
VATSLTARVRRHILDVDFALDVDRAPVTVLFGPSGAGKTTLLRCLAGLDRPEPGGHISLGGQVWDDRGVHVPARHRQVGYLFQDHALFPFLDVAGNVAYGLHHLPRQARPARVRDALDAAGAAHLAGRPTRQLSGGEAQRVALARALAPGPQLLLLDEPLSALDGPTRARLRAELRSRLLAAGVPTVVVTHDRAEALALGDHIAVLIDGRLRQLGTVPDVFSRPADPLVADAVDMETIAPGTVTGYDAGLATVSTGDAELYAASDEELCPGAQVLVCVRAEHVALRTADDSGRTSARNELAATITAITPHGPVLRIDLDGGFAVAAYVTHPTRDELGLEPGQRVTAVIKATAIHLVPHPEAPS